MANEIEYNPKPILTTDNLNGVNQVLEDSSFVAQNAEHVTIDDRGVERITNTILQSLESGSEFNYDQWTQQPLNPKLNQGEDFCMNWIFLVDCLNFSFWSDEVDPLTSLETKYQVEYKGNTYTGYWTLPASINKAIENGVNLTDFDVILNLKDEELVDIFKSDSGIVNLPPLVNFRVEIMKEAAKILKSEFQGQVKNLIVAAEGSALKLMELIVHYFPSFRDYHEYKGRSVKIYKRAQIFVADLWACFQGTKVVNFNDIDEITMFADYRVPQVLNFMGALTYSPKLQTLINDKVELKNGCQFEVELRAGSIWVVELVKRRLYQLGKTHFNSILIDFYLWEYAKFHSEKLKKIEIHRTRTYFY